MPRRMTPRYSRSARGTLANWRQPSPSVIWVSFDVRFFTNGFLLTPARGHMEHRAGANYRGLRGTSSNAPGLLPAAHVHPARGVRHFGPFVPRPPACSRMTPCPRLTAPPPFQLAGPL